MERIKETFFIVVVMTTLIVAIGTTGYGAILFPIGGGEMYGDVVTIKGDTVLFKLKPTSTVVPFPIETVDKISFDENTKDGVGLILSNGLNFKSAVPLSFDGKQFVFKLQFATLIITDSKAVSFLSIRNVKETVLPSETEKVWSLETENGEYAQGDILLYKDGVYVFKTKYGNLQVPEDNVLLISRLGKTLSEVGIDIAGNIIKGNIDEFKDGKFRIKTDYGWLENVDEGVVTGIRYEKREEKQEKGKMYLLLKDGERFMGKVMSWSGGTLIFKTDYGQLVISEKDVMTLKSEAVASDIKIETEPNGAITATPMPTARYALAAVSVEGKIYAIGGYNGKYLNTIEVYDTERDIWTKAAPMPTSRELLAAVVVGKKIYAIGGYDGKNALNTVEVYNTEKNVWTKAAPMPTSRECLAAAAVGKKIYVIGGYNGNYLNTIEVYDTEKNVWTKGAPIPTPRSDLAAVAVGKKIYAIGGYNYGCLNTVEVYIPKY